MSKVRSGLDFLERAAETHALRLALFALVALATTWPLLSNAPAMNMFRDAQVLMSYERSAVESVSQYLQLPLWDPYYCGGIYGLGSPQSRFVSPTFLLSLLFGSVRGESITAFAMILLGLEGTYRYALSRGASALGAVFAAPVFALSGSFATAPYHGWINFFGFELLPWAGYGVRSATQGSTRGAVIGAAALAWIVGFGGTYAGPMAALVCLFEVILALLARILKPRELGRALGLSFICAALAVGLSLVRLWPVAETLAVAERVLGDKPSMTWRAVYDASAHQLRFSGDNILWYHGTYFIGLFALPAAAVGLLRPRALPVVLLGSLSAWAATGYADGWSPFVGLRALPVFSVLRYPDRYLILVALCMSAVGALGATVLIGLAKKRGWLLGLPLLVIVALGYNTFLQIRNHHSAAQHMSRAAPAPTVERPFHQARGTRWLLGYYGPMSRGSLSCWDAYPVPQSPLLRGDLKAEEYLPDAAVGDANRTSWSPNRIDVAVHALQPTQLRINQNWHPGWRSNVGKVVSEGGLIAVDLPAGEHEVTLRFLPRSAIGGGLASLAATGAAVWLWRRGRIMPGPRSRRDWLLQLGAVVAPAAVAGLCWAAIPEPPMRMPAPLAPDGEVIYVDTLPAEVTPIHVQFAEGARIVGASVRPSTVTGGGEVKVELDFQTEQSLPSGVGVFVHLVGSKGGFINADHMRISSALELADAPEGKILRDIFIVGVPRTAPRGEWAVWVGLWKTRSGGKRLEIIDAGSAETERAKVKVATFVVE